MLHPDVLPLLQAALPTIEAIPLGLVIPLVAVALVASMVMLFVSRYKRCPSNRVLVISGRVAGGESARCISGGGAFVWPVIQEYAYLGLEPIQIDIPLKDALSLENIRVAVPSVFTVAVGTESEVRQNAAIRILGLTHEQIKRQAQDIIFGQLRQVIASMRIEEINRDREGFLHRVQTSLEPELAKIGLVLINVNITDLKDDSGYIEAIGQKAAAQAVQQARGDVAEQEKTGEVRVAEAQRERSVSVALAQKDMHIGMQVASREQAVRLAELEKERMVGEQQAGFQRDMAVKEAEQLKRVAVASAEAIAIAGEAESQGRVVATKATLLVKEAEAYQLAETRKREAEASVQEAQFKAQTRAALADADRIEAMRRAELEAPAKAEKARTIVEAQAAAEARTIEAQAEATAIYMKLEAEARGQYEIMAKKADAMRQLVDAAGGAKEAYQLLMLEHLDTLAETSAKAISNIKFDKVVVWDGGNGTTSNFLQNMSRTLPPMMHVLQDIAGVELPAFLGKLTPAAGDGVVIPPEVKTPATVEA
ncbi:MAG: flotillin family protein [Gemmatimonadaceae bacterium]|nr:flotillin family protein [Gemmatimonadaceae bacterium]